MLPRARLQSPAQFRRAVARAVLAVDPREAEEQHHDERAQRHVRCWPAEHGMAVLRAYGPAEDIETLRTAVQAIADKAKTDAAAAGAPDCRTADQLRFDALTGLAAHALTGCPDATVAADPGIATGTWQGRKPAVQVTVALAVPPPRISLFSSRPSHTERAAVAIAFQRKLPTSTWRRLVTDEVGQLLDYGRSTYKPPQDLIDFVTARDAVCRFPHCGCNSRRCELPEAGTRWRQRKRHARWKATTRVKSGEAGQRPGGPSRSSLTAPCAGPARPATSTKTHPTSCPSTTPPSDCNHPRTTRRFDSPRTAA